MSDEQMEATKFQIFRGEEGTDLAEANCCTMLPMTEVQMKGFASLLDPAKVRGDETTVLFSAPGFSLVYAWFKSGYPLPLHSHDADCLYYIVSGSLKLGTEELGARDGFFIPGGVPYTYTPGPDGLEIIEFRHEQTFDMDVQAKGEKFWDKAALTAEARQEAWASEKRPALNA